MAKHRKHRREANVPVSAFSDIAFLLIIFFILATTLVHVTGMVTEIPSGEKKEAKEEKETATVQLNGQRVLFNDKPVSMKQLRAELAKLKLHQKSEDDKIVMLEPAKNVPYQNFFDVLASINAAGGVAAILEDEE